MEQKMRDITVTVHPAPQGIPSTFDVDFTTAVEMLHIFGMGQWETTAPPPGKFGWRGGIVLENSQQARLQYLLVGIGRIDPEKTYSTLSAKTRSHRTLDSKITTNKPAQGLPLIGHWHLDCCLNLGQKFEIVEALRHLDYSRHFVEIAKRFVEGLPIAESGAH